MLRLIHTSTKTVMDGSSTNSLIYVPSQDTLLGYELPTDNQISKIYRDGTQIEMGILHTTGISDVDEHPLEGIAVASSLSLGTNYFLDPITWNYDYNREFTTGMSDVNRRKGLFLRNSAGVLKYYVQLTDRIRKFDSATGLLDSDLTISNSVNPIGGLHWAGGNRVLIMYTDGEVKIVDIETDEIILDSFVEPAEVCAYDTTYNNIMTMRVSDGAIQTWDTRIQPDSLSALSFTPGSFDRYTKETVSVTVLGSNSEPVPDIDVQWTLTSIKGSISPEFTKTNSLGVATATYCPHGLDWILADEETITATVVT